MALDDNASVDQSQSSSDTSQTTPQNGQMDQTGTSDTPGTPRPQQSPESTAAAHPFPGDQVQSPQQSQQGQPEAQKPSQQPQIQQPAPKPVDPAVAKATRVNTIMQALSGGPNYSTKIDPNTGSVVRTEVPQTGRQEAMTLAKAILTGAFSGLGEKGPGAEGRAAQAGFEATLKQQQDKKAQQDLEASQTYGRQAQIAQTNFQTRENALRLNNMDYDFQNKIVGANQETLDNARSEGHVVADDVAPEDLFPKYHVTKDQAIPSRVTEVENSNGTKSIKTLYTVIDPEGKIQIPQNVANEAAAHHIPGTFKVDANGKTIPIDFQGGAAAKLKFVNNLLQTSAATNITEQSLNNGLSKLAEATGKDFGKVDIKDAFDNGGLSAKALKAFIPYSGYDHIDQAIDDFQKSKANQDSGGVLAGQIRNLLPKDAYDASKKQRLDQEAADKATRDRQAKVLEQQAELPGKIEEAKLKAKINSSNAFLEGYNHEAGTQAAKTAAGVASGTLTSKLKNNDLYAVKSTGQITNGVDQGYLDQLKATDPAIASAVDAVGHGQAFVSNYGLAKDAGQHFLGLVHQAFPDFAVGKANEYEKQLVDFGANGKTGKANAAASTTLEHLLRLYDSLGIGSMTGFSGQADINKANALNEMGNFYANGNKAGENELKDYRDAFNKNPYTAGQAAVGAAEAMLDKVKENYNVQARAVPSTFGKPEPILSEDAANAYNKLTHKTVPDYLVDHKVQSRAYAGQQSAGQPNQSPTAPTRKNPDLPGAATIKKGSDGNYYQFDQTGKYLGPA